MTPPRSDDSAREESWCFLRNLVHTAYRELRHIGPSSDSGARLEIGGGPYASTAQTVSSIRLLLKSTSLFKRTAQAKTVDEVLEPYETETGLQLADLPHIFRLHGWDTGYGGPKWAVIAEAAGDLAAALRTGDLVQARSICARVKTLRHNSDSLVPSARAWRETAYLQEKWPELCD